MTDSYQRAQALLNSLAGTSIVGVDADGWERAIRKLAAELPPLTDDTRNLEPSAEMSAFPPTDAERLSAIRRDYNMLEWSGDVGDDVVFLLRLLDEAAERAIRAVAAELPPMTDDIRNPEPSAAATEFARANWRQMCIAARDAAFLLDAFVAAEREACAKQCDAASADLTDRADIMSNPNDVKQVLCVKG